MPDNPLTIGTLTAREVEAIRAFRTHSRREGQNPWTFSRAAAIRGAYHWTNGRIMVNLVVPPRGYSSALLTIDQVFRHYEAARGGTVERAKRIAECQVGSFSALIEILAVYGQIPWELTQTYRLGEYAGRRRAQDEARARREQEAGR